MVLFVGHLEIIHLAQLFTFFCTFMDRLFQCINCLYDLSSGSRHRRLTWSLCAYSCN